jgi:orotidine-5'-phosphate decarboxylase
VGQQAGDGDLNAIEKYNRRAKAVSSLLCVGLDSDFHQLPEEYVHYEFPLFTFNRWVIEQTHAYVSAYKPNMAFYEARGDRGMTSLRMTMDYLHEHHPDILTICDAKRGDLASSSAAYALSVFEWFGFDAVTLNPYQGRDALQPFLDYANKGCIILGRTSNPSAGEFQDLQVGDKTLWEMVAHRVSGEWNTNGNCMLVMGATYPDKIRQARGIVGDMPLLVPGIGAQGGSIAQTLAAGLTGDGLGLIISASRSIIFAEKPGMAAKNLRDEINAHRA